MQLKGWLSEGMQNWDDLETTHFTSRRDRSSQRLFDMIRETRFFVRDSSHFRTKLDIRN